MYVITRSHNFPDYIKRRSLLTFSVYVWQEQDIGWAEPCKEVSFNTEKEECLEKAEEAGKREGCLLRKPPQPSGETIGRLVSAVASGTFLQSIVQNMLNVYFIEVEIKL